jgi:hypothetical protein
MVFGFKASEPNGVKRAENVTNPHHSNIIPTSKAKRCSNETFKPSPFAKCYRTKQCVERRTKYKARCLKG